MIGSPKVFRQSGYTFAIERESSFYHNKKRWQKNARALGPTIRS